jgi:hypothetical protein
MKLTKFVTGSLASAALLSANPALADDDDDTEQLRPGALEGGKLDQFVGVSQGNLMTDLWFAITHCGTLTIDAGGE